MLPNRRRSAMDVKWSDCGWNDSRSPDPVPWSDVTYKALNVRELWEGLTLRRLAAFADPGLGVLPRRAWNPGHPGVTPSPGGTLPIIAFRKRKVPYLASVLNLNQIYRDCARHADRKRRCPVRGQHRRHLGRLHALGIHLRRHRLERVDPGGDGEGSGGDGRRAVDHSGVLWTGLFA